MSKYIASFAIGSLAGIANEVIQNPDHWCLTKPSAKALVTCTVGNLYGWSAMVAVALFEHLDKLGVSTALPKILIATTVAISIEAIGGALSRHFHNGKQTWKYPKQWIPMFGGYISVVSSIYFGLGIAAFYFLIYKQLHKFSTPSI